MLYQHWVLVIFMRHQSMGLRQAGLIGMGQLMAHYIVKELKTIQIRIGHLLYAYPAVLPTESKWYEYKQYLKLLKIISFRPHHCRTTFTRPSVSSHGLLKQWWNKQLGPCQSVLPAPNPSTDGTTRSIHGCANNGSNDRAARSVDAADRSIAHITTILDDLLQYMIYCVSGKKGFTLSPWWHYSNQDNTLLCIHKIHMVKQLTESCRIIIFDMQGKKFKKATLYS